MFNDIDEPADLRGTLPVEWLSLFLRFESIDCNQREHGNPGLR